MVYIYIYIQINMDGYIYIHTPDIHQIGQKLNAPPFMVDMSKLGWP